MPSIRITVSLLLALLLVQPNVHAWSEGGHHLIAVMAFELLEPTEQEKILAILKSHPRYAEDFSPPEYASNKNRWVIGTAGYWPDIARSYPEWTRPTWHFELGAALKLGDVTDVPDFPGPLPESATLETRDLHISQAIALCRKVLASPSEPTSAKALAITWLCHLVADSHQPCHAGSLYAEHVFPEGDRGANSIPVAQGSNMHSLWDGLLGRHFDEGDIARRRKEILGDAQLMAEVAFGIAHSDTLLPSTWLEESRTYARRYVYAPEVMEPITVALRAQEAGLQPISLSENYLKNAGRFAQLRAAQAAFRLARILSQDLVLATESETDNSTTEPALTQPIAPRLIAHRGGVVDTTRVENNVDAIEEAIARNYFMLEVDIRESRDGQLVVHHDTTFSRFYFDDRSLADMTWNEIQSLRSHPRSHAPLSFGQFAALCRGRIELMIDTKGPDHSPDFFEEMERILRENDLLDSAIIIGTQQSRQFFTGKAKIGVNAAQLRTAVEDGVDASRLHVLFAHGKDLDEATVQFAKSHNVTVVPSVNIFHYPLGSHLVSASADILRLKNMGVTHFQIDSVYDQFLINELKAPQIDGILSDWKKEDVKRTDPKGDAIGAFDISEVSVKIIGSQVFLKFDTGRKLNLQNGPEEDGTLILKVELPDEQTLSVDFRKRKAVVSGPESQSSVVPWRDLNFVSLPTYSADEFELRLDLAKLGVEPGDAIGLNFFGSDTLDTPVQVIANQAEPVFSDLPTTARPVGSMRIASMNTLRSGLADSERQGVFKELIQFAAADIYCFNEEWDEEKFQSGLQTMFPEQNISSEWSEGCAVASIHELERLDVGLARGVAVLARVPNADPTVIISVHFKCCGFDGSPEDQQRVQEAEAIAQAIRKIRSGGCGEEAVDAGIVVLGDYNLVGSRRPLEIIEGEGMKEYLLRSPIDGTAATWQGISPSESFWPGRLDYVTYSPNTIEVKGGFLLNNQILTELRSVPAKSELVSDHAMLVVDVASVTASN